jgi:hypothetical protein
LEYLKKPSFKFFLSLLTFNLQEQTSKKDLEEKIREKDIEIKQKREELESVTFTNSKLTKRIESLVEDVNKISKKED